VLRDVRDRVIENHEIGPCAGAGIEIWNSQNVVIRGTTINDTASVGVYVFGSTGVSVTESRITDAASGVYAVESTGVRVGCNTIEDVTGPMPRGQLVQFDKVRGEGNEISCNAGQNRPGRSVPEDAISIYESNGVSGRPIMVRDNLIIGGGPSESGGGVMLGDNGGSHQTAQANILVDPGQYGVAIASGTNMSIIDNQVYARQQSFTNVGISVWNQYPYACGGITVRGNSVNYTSKNGRPNPFWDAGNCGVIAGLVNNLFSAVLTAAIATTPAPAACSCQTQGRKPG
jgi:hypothetical protein